MVTEMNTNHPKSAKARSIEVPDPYCDNTVTSQISSDSRSSVPPTTTVIKSRGVSDYVTSTSTHSFPSSRTNTKVAEKSSFVVDLDADRITFTETITRLPDQDEGMIESTSSTELIINTISYQSDVESELTSQFPNYQISLEDEVAHSAIPTKQSVSFSSVLSPNTWMTTAISPYTTSNIPTNIPFTTEGQDQSIFIALGLVIAIVLFSTIGGIIWLYRRRLESRSTEIERKPLIVQVPRVQSPEITQLLQELEITGVANADIDRIRDSFRFSWDSSCYSEEKLILNESMIFQTVDQTNSTEKSLSKRSSTSDPFRRSQTNLFYPASLC
jgi:hypothetical protein